MKLSEAIRLGAMVRPQVTGNFFAVAGSCAFGAAYEAAGLSVYDEHLNVTDDHPCATAFPIVKVLASHPISKQGQWSVGAAIVSLNDDFRWTREQIADWVETIEAQQALVPIPEDAQKVTA